MRAVTFLTKKQVRLCYPQLRFAAVLYAAVPVAVFLLGWLKLYWGIPAAALLAAGVLGLRPGRKEPSAAAAEKAVCVPVWALAVVLVFALAWCFLGGQGGYFYQNSDFANRNGVLHDLVNYPWPVYYQSDSGGFGNHGNPFALVYYICHWLLPALAGKLVLAVTGAVGAAWLAANFALFVWTCLGVFLVFCLLAVTLRPQSWAALLAVCVGFMAFSGLDIVGTVWMHQDVGFHIERWAGVNEYSSMTTCLFWVFNQTVGAWLATVCFLQEKDCRNYLLLGTACLMCGPFPFVGLVIFMVVRGIVLLAQRQKGVLQSAFSPANVLVLVVVLSITASYFLANNAFGYSVLGETVAGNQAAQQTFGQNVLTSLQKGMLVFYLLDAGISDIWAKSVSKEHARILQRIGARHIINAETDAGKRVGHLVSGNYLDYIELEGAYNVVKIHTPPHVVGYTIGDARVHERFGITVVGIKSPGKEFEYGSKELIMHRNDELIIMGKQDQIDRFARG